MRHVTKIVKIKLTQQLGWLIGIAWLLSSVLIPGQEWEWARHDGGTNYDAGYAVATDTLGNAYVAGIFNEKAEFGDITLTNKGVFGTDIFVEKINPQGSLLWIRQIGGSYDDRAMAIVCDEDGNVYVAGSFTGTNTSFGDFKLSTTGPYGACDMFVAKFDPSGNVVWATSAGGYNEDIAYGIALDRNGYVVVIGQFEDEFHFGNTLLVTGYQIIDPFIAKFDSHTGAKIWAKSIQGKKRNNRGNSVTVDDFGNIYATGSFQDTATFGQFTVHSSGSSDDAYLAKYSPDGDVIWVNPIGDAGSDMGMAVTLNNTNIVYLSAKIAVPLANSPLEPSVTYSNYFMLAAYESNGKQLWSTDGGGSSLVIDQNTNLYANGIFSTNINIGSTLLELKGICNYFLVKSDSNGKVQWIKTAGGFDVLWDGKIAVDLNSNVFLTGAFRSTATFNKDTLISNGFMDVCVAKLSSSLPNIFKEPRNVTAKEGETAVFSIGVSNSYPVAYQWLKNNQPLDESLNITGTKTSSLTISNLSWQDIAEYAVIVTGDKGSVTSSVATLNLGELTRFVSTETLVNGLIQVNFTGEQGRFYLIEASTDWQNWSLITNFYCPQGVIKVIDFDATNYSQRYYRAVSP